MIPHLRALLAPASPDDLLSAMHERRRLFARPADGQRFHDLLPWPAINALFASHRFGPDRLRVVQASNELPASMYRDPLEPARVRLDALQALASQGVTILINRIDQLVPAIDAAASMLERETRTQRSVNAYLTFLQHSAFPPHWDVHDVVVLQLHGRKRWRSYGIRAVSPAGGHSLGRNEDPGPVEWEQVLEPGDVLYMPRGELHAAAVEPGDTSVHITVGLLRPRGRDVLQWLAQGDDEALRTDVFPIPRGEMKSREADLRAALHRIVDGLDLDAFLAHADRERELRMAPNLGATIGMGPETTLHCALPRRGPLRASFGLSETAGAMLTLLQQRDSMTLAEIRDTLGRAYEDVRTAAAEIAQKGLVHVNAGNGHG